MATTKIWAIKGSIGKVLDYANDPRKVQFTDLKQVLKYAENGEKTIDNEEHQVFVTGVNCNRDTAYQEMKAVQERFNKTTGNVAYHAYQSFKTGEVTAELAHKIGVELAQKMFSEYQVLVATHLNTGTYHNHFVINSVNMFTGEKFNCNKGAYYKFRSISDALCAENNLTVIKNPKGRTARNIYFAEKRGEPTKYNLMREAIDEALDITTTVDEFKNVMIKKGYVINDSDNRKYATIRRTRDTKATRLFRLGEEYTMENIEAKVLSNPPTFYYDYKKFMNTPLSEYNKDLAHSEANSYSTYNRSKYQRNTNVKTYKYKGSFDDLRKKSCLELLFLLLLYLMGARPLESPQNHYQKHIPLSPEMKAEIRKMDRYSEHVRLIAGEKIKTEEDLDNFILKTEDEIKEVEDIRQHYRNKLRHCTDESKIVEYKRKRDDCSKVIENYRKKLKTAKQIKEDIPKVKEKIAIEKEMCVADWEFSKGLLKEKQEKQPKRRTKDRDLER